jgi:hypothetical protein
MVVCFTTAVQLSFYSILRFSDWISFQLLEFQKDSEATDVVLGMNGADSKPEIQNRFMECYVAPFCTRHPVLRNEKKHHAASRRGQELNLGVLGVEMNLNLFNRSLHQMIHVKESNGRSSPGGKGFMVRNHTYDQV